MSLTPEMKAKIDTSNNLRVLFALNTQQAVISAVGAFDPTERLLEIGSGDGFLREIVLAGTPLRERVTPSNFPDVAGVYESCYPNTPVLTVDATNPEDVTRAAEQLGGSPIIIDLNVLDSILNIDAAIQALGTSSSRILHIMDKSANLFPMFADPELKRRNIIPVPFFEPDTQTEKTAWIDKALLQSRASNLANHVALQPVAEVLQRFVNDPFNAFYEYFFQPQEGHRSLTKAMLELLFDDLDIHEFEEYARKRLEKSLTAHGFTIAVETELPLMTHVSREVIPASMKLSPDTNTILLDRTTGVIHQATLPTDEDIPENQVMLVSSVYVLFAVKKNPDTSI